MKTKPTKEDLIEYKRLARMVSAHEDATKFRIAMSNRLGLSKKEEADSFHLGVTADVANALPEVERLLEKDMKVQLKSLPTGLIAFQKSTKGLGEKLFARLIGYIGHPCWKVEKWYEGETLLEGEVEPRTVGQLWQYSGVGRAAKRKKGMSFEAAKALGNQKVGPVLHLIAESFLKTKNEHYRSIYDDAKAKSKEVHHDWTDGHHHNHALRIVKKRFLQDLWVAAQDV